MGHVEMSKLAADRTPVAVVRDGRIREGKLIYWSSKLGRAKVMLASGAVITVGTDTIVLQNERNIVADEISDDTKYRNFRSLRADNTTPTDHRRPQVGMPPVRGAVGSVQPRVGCETDEPNHVEGIQLPARDTVPHP